MSTDRKAIPIKRESVCQDQDDDSYKLQIVTIIQERVVSLLNTELDTTLSLIF